MTFGFPGPRGPHGFESPRPGGKRTRRNASYVFFIDSSKGRGPSADRFRTTAGEPFALFFSESSLMDWFFPDPAFWPLLDYEKSFSHVYSPNRPSEKSSSARKRFRPRSFRRTISLPSSFEQPLDQNHPGEPATGLSLFSDLSDSVRSKTPGPSAPGVGRRFRGSARRTSDDRSAKSDRRSADGVLPPLEPGLSVRSLNLTWPDSSSFFPNHDEDDAVEIPSRDANTRSGRSASGGFRASDQAFLLRSRRG
jgi:hypothetical protein